jgi:hypothetical protein
MIGTPGISSSIAFVTSSGTTTAAGRIACAEFNGPPTTRKAVIAKDPCTFDGQYVSGPSTSATIPYWVAGASPPPDVGGVPWTTYYPVLQPNTLYYWNMITDIDGSEYCPAAGCGWFVDFAPDH